MFTSTVRETTPSGKHRFQFTCFYNVPKFLYLETKGTQRLVLLSPARVTLLERQGLVRVGQACGKLWVCGQSAKI